MIDSFIMWSLANFEHQNFILAAKSMGALKRNVLRPMFQILAAKKIPYRYVRGEDPHVLIGTNVYYLFGGNNDASQDTVQGLTAAGALLDEIALMPESFVEQVIARCSVYGAKWFATCNPDGGPTHWFKQGYIDKAKRKRIVYLHFTMDDNLTLSPEVKARYKRTFSGLWYKRYILGLWVMAEGAVYDMWDDDRNLVADVPRDQNGVAQIRRWWIACDYGTTNPFVALLIGEGTDGRLYVVAEYRWDSKAQRRQLTDAQYSAALSTFMDQHLPPGIMPERIFVDPSAASFIVQLHQDRVKDARLGRVAQADNAVLGGIRATATLLAMGLLKVNKACKGLIAEITGYVWDAKAQERGEDAPLKQADHGPDALRYGVNGTRTTWLKWVQKGRVA
jgi:PBSX family phage terminase large subunit